MIHENQMKTKENGLGGQIAYVQMTLEAKMSTNIQGKLSFFEKFYFSTKIWHPYTMKVSITRTIIFLTKRSSTLRF